MRSWLKKAVGAVRKSLLLKMLCMGFVIVLVPSIGIGVFGYLSNYESSREQNAILNEELFALNSATLQNRMLSFQKYAMTFYSDADEQLVRALTKTAAYTYEDKQLISKKMEEVYLVDSSVRGISIEDNNKRKSENYEYNYKNLWYKELPGGFYPEGFSILGGYDENNFAVYRKALINYPSTGLLCELNVYFTPEPFENFGVLMQGSDADSIVTIWDAKSGLLLYSTHPVELSMKDISVDGKDMDFSGELGGKKGVFYARLISVGESRFYVMKFVSNRTIAKSAGAFLLNTVIVQILVLALMFIYIYFLYRSIVLPIAKLDKNMEQVKTGIYRYKAVSKAEDEIGRLDRKYADMVESINRFINEDMRKRIEIAQANLKALQAQINPHFLNNMLQSISTQALYEGAEDVYISIGNLARIFQYNMDTANDKVTLGEEISHIDNYLELQKQRFGESLNYSINYQQDTAAVLVPKMILQPLVENSIKYGRQKSGGTCEIGIDLRLENGELSLTVSDNGIGLSDAQVLQIQQDFIDYQTRIEHGHGIGLLNVLWRIDIFSNSRMVWECADNAPGLKLSIKWKIWEEAQDESSDN